MLYLAGYLNTNETPEDGPEMHHVDRPNKDSSRGAAGGDSVGNSSTAFSTRKSVLVTSCGFPRCMAALRHAIASVRTHPPSGHRHRCKSSFLALLFVTASLRMAPLSGLMVSFQCWRARQRWALSAHRCTCWRWSVTFSPTLLVFSAYQPLIVSFKSLTSSQ